MLQQQTLIYVSTSGSTQLNYIKTSELQEVLVMLPHNLNSRPNFDTAITRAFRITGVIAFE